ncbi:TonB-dependent receptor [Acidicapsa ligni]|uniref:TonB-dependent receptor n=1 Tax=Acidicapsa ligni TaxID=542300 RepID=UPI0021E0A975|nr:carboxypeptidase-like regulatory domain-containing protein [Acidicapsa ligni]
MYRLFSRFAPLLAFVALAGCLQMMGQPEYSSLSGRVTDPTGAVIQEATVQIINQDTLVKREVTTGATGEYSLLALPAGRYQVIVEANGFSRRSSQVFTLLAGKAIVFNVQIVVSDVRGEVSVSAGASETTIDTDTASISTTLGTEEVTGLALNGRNFSQLAMLAPGVSNQTGQDEAKVGLAGSAKFSVNGGRVEYNTFEVDGSDVLNTSINASRGQGEPLIVYPSVDAIQDLKILTGDYSAIYGKSSSGSVLITTKSGSDKYHGNAYGFLRNEMFNARNYFDQPNPMQPGYQGKPTYRTPLYRRLDFGGTFGGPVPYLHRGDSKTFFFLSEEIRREKTPVDYNQAVPTMAERSGDFSDVCPPFVPGSGLTPDPAYPDCPINPTTNLIQRHVATDYTSLALLNSELIPAPNSSSGCNSTTISPLPHCYVASVSPLTTYREELFRIDHDLSQRTRLSYRYVHDTYDSTVLAPLYGIVHNSFPTVENRLSSPGENMAVILTQALPHNFLNLVSASYEVEHITLNPEPGVGVESLARPIVLDDPGKAGGVPVAGATVCSNVSRTNAQQVPAQITECPVGHIFDNGYGGKLPGLVFQGSNGAYGGHGFSADTGYAPYNQSNPTFIVRDDASKAIGKHNLQWGFWGAFVQQNELSAVSGANSGDVQGLITFSNQQSIHTSGNAFADFIAGTGFRPQDLGPSPGGAIKSFTQDSGQLRYYTRNKTAEFYLQDDFKVSPRFTINAGLRASLFGAWYNPRNTAYNWRPEDFNQSLGASIFIDPIAGNLVNRNGGSAVPLKPTGPYSLSSLGPVITNGLAQCGVNGIPDSCMRSKLFYPSPRFGFSWDPWGKAKTAIHGGYGLFWQRGTGYESNVGSLIGGAPLVLSETQSNISGAGTDGQSIQGYNAYNLIGLSCQGGTIQCPVASGATIPAGGATFPLNVTSIPTRAIYSYTQQWSLSVQHELRKGLVGQFIYVGTKGTHLTAVRDLNQLPSLGNTSNPFGKGQPITPDFCQSGANGGFIVGGLNPPQGPVINPSAPTIGPASQGYVNAFVACTGNPGFALAPVSQGGPSRKLGISADVARPYLGFSNIISVENVADSEYNALQATLREVTGPITVDVAYTYSHSLDDSSDRASANFADSLDIHSNHASSDFDQRHLLNISYIYNLPLLKLFGGMINLLGSGQDPTGETVPVMSKSDLWAPSPVMKTLLGGWQLSGITTFNTGTPFSVVNGGGANGIGSSDNAGVGDGLGIGSYPDVIGKVHSGKPFVSPGGNNVGPLLLNPNAYAAPRGLTFGNAGRNSLSNPSRVNFNTSLFKHFKSSNEKLDIEFRAEAFNILNHTQFRITDPANPGNIGNNVINCYGSQSQFYSAGASGCLVGNSFLHPVDAHDPRILQFALKGSF